ncbi:conserved Plasmodium protein, unknown function [Plasmodium malariae]|uniref:RAP domain-containing protein n=1 Tax=Plasmodium malariae TaxID=5858 RepID=A0A1D3PBJ3_PLAMA|nr:conserved Plasmodium protein, unknown function [Plasmodium malariae]SCN12664.1 conserved Plasmodium protein, unknown function [Plasmodium malariae]
MIVLFTNVIFKRSIKWTCRLLLHGQYFVHPKIQCCCLFKNYYSTGVPTSKVEILSCKVNENIINHIKKEYDIDSNSINLNVKRSCEEKNIYEMSMRWSNFFKCEKSLYNVINKYLKTNRIDYYLHNYLKLTYDEKLDNMASVAEGTNLESPNNSPFNSEEEIKNILIYIMALSYKNIRDFNIISALSEKLISLLKNLTKEYKNKTLIFTICEVYNCIKAMNDELFSILFDMLNSCYVTSRSENIIMNEEEILLILKTLYNQNYKNHSIVDTVINSIKMGTNLKTNVLLVNSFFYLTLLSRMDNSLIENLHSFLFYVTNETCQGSLNEMMDNPKTLANQGHIDKLVKEGKRQTCSDNIYTTENFEKTDEPGADVKRTNSAICADYTKLKMDGIKFKIELSATDCIKLLYSYLALGEDYINWFLIHKLLLKLCDDIKDDENILLIKEKKKTLEMVCIIRSYLRYKKRNFYDNLPKYVKKMLKKIYMMDIHEKKINDRLFNEKLSWHLTKLRIPHIRNVYKGGIVFDILEKDKRLVWLCFSYHHYYVKTIDLTIEKLLQMDIIQSMNYKIAKIHYYQFSRMKARRTRFEYIRMCRYYSLRDRRNFDDQFEGWNLPYINWYHKKNKNVHISNYFYNYTPVSQMEY